MCTSCCLSAANGPDAVHDTGGAVKYYEKVVELWRNADPVLQPLVRADRERIAAIGTRLGRPQRRQDRELPY